MISIVIPIYNEDRIIEQLYQRTTKALEAIGERFEVLCVDDGSSDQSLDKIVELHTRDSRFKVLSLSRNFGHQSAVMAGLTYSKGDFIGIMDGDLQDPPEIFIRFYEKIHEGYDVVYGVRRNRKENVIKRAAYWLYYRLLRSMSGMEIPLDSGDFSLINRQVLDEMLKLSEHSLFVRGVRSWVGYKQIGLEYERDARVAGRAKYGFCQLLQLAYNGIFGFSDVPIKFLGRLGILAIAISVSYSLYVVVQKVMFDSVPQGFTALILAIVFFGGVQLVGLRILGEYMHRIYDETKKRPLFIVAQSYLD